MNGKKCDSEIQKLFVFNHISVALYCIINCLIVFIVISVLRLEYLNLRWEKSYCIILPRVLYHFAPCTVSFCRVHGAKWYSWHYILNAWFQALMSLYACFSFSQVVANTWQCIKHLKAIRYIIKAGKNILKKWIILPRSPLTNLPIHLWITILLSSWRENTRKIRNKLQFSLRITLIWTYVEYVDSHEYHSARLSHDHIVK